MSNTHHQNCSPTELVSNLVDEQNQNHSNERGVIGTDQEHTLVRPHDFDRLVARNDCEVENDQVNENEDNGPGSNTLGNIDHYESVGTYECVSGYEVINGYEMMPPIENIDNRTHIRGDSGSLVESTKRVSEQCHRN